MSKHTPGPWNVQAQTGYSHRVLPKAESPEEHLANARLIAAAPQMLECLKYCQKWFEKWAPTADMVDGKLGELPMLTAVKAAIAEAEGKNEIK